jgi:virulence-associated protein VagC
MKKEKKILLKKAILLAQQNNIRKNLPLTIVKITDYKDDNITVNRERIYLVFNKGASKQFTSAVFDVLENIVKFEFGKINIQTTPEFIEFWGTGMQLSRKNTAPILEPIVKAFNEYFYSPSNALWIKRDFLKKSHDLMQAMKQEKLHASFDAESRINYLTYPEARILANNLDFAILTLKEYRFALGDAKKIKDIQMIESLQGSNFVEFLDTVFKDYSIMIQHPQILKK